MFPLSGKSVPFGLIVTMPELYVVEMLPCDGGHPGQYSQCSQMFGWFSDCGFCSLNLPPQHLQVFIMSGYQRTTGLFLLDESQRATH